MGVIVVSPSRDIVTPEGDPDMPATIPLMAGDLQRWLSDIGLGSHAERFAADGIDWDVLPDLTETDLKELGLPLGDRKRLLKAVAAMNAPEAALAAPDHHDPPGQRTLTTEGDAARRQITVMFVDLVDSTPLSEQLDPEDLREVLRSFHTVCAGAIEVEDGYIARYMGDGILVYFGYPQAHEDDAARAVRAGLRIIDGLQAANGRLEQEHGVRLRSRIGIHTGLVVVGEVGAGSARDRDAIVGETPNIAARLQAEARPDTLVLGGATQRLIEGLFALEDLGPRQLKGVSVAVRAWRALHELDAVDRFDARTRRGMTPLIGRVAELEMLNQRWMQACDGEMRCVLVAGEAGIGKSRFLRAFRDGLVDPHQTISLYCSPYHRNSAFAPLIEWLCRVLELKPRSDPEGAVVALETAATVLGLDAREITPILAAFLGLPVTGHYQPVDAETGLFKRRIVETLTAIFAANARRQPLLVIVEDAHWIDPSTLELLREVLEQLATMRLLLVITARPEFKPDWSHAHSVQINLDRLSRRDRAAMVEIVAGGQQLPEFVLEQIITKTDGVPLFVEELTKSVLESRVLRDSGNRHEPSDPFHGIAIPDTLQGSLLARLDRLQPEAKAIAQLGAAIGREFGRDLLALVTGQSGEALDDALRQLVAAEIVQPAPRSTLGYGAYAFRHVLIQEAAYQSLLLVRRRQYHAAIADALTGNFPEVAALMPEVIARHLTAADLVDRAVDAWLHAGDNARKRGTFTESLAHLERGLGLVPRLPGSAAVRARRMMSLLLVCGAVETQMLSPRSLATFQKVAGMAREQGLTAELIVAALGFADAEMYALTQTAASISLLEEALAAVGNGETVERYRILSRLARALLYIGSSDRGQEVMRQARALTQHLDDRQSLWDLAVCELMPNGAPPLSAAQFGERRRTLEWMVQVAEEERDHKYWASFMRAAPAFLEIGDVDGFEAMAQRLMQSTASIQLDKWFSITMQAMGAISRGEFQSAEQLATEALALGDASDFDFPLGVYGMQMFTIRREQGRMAEAAPLVKRFVQEHPEDAAWRPGLMLIASDLGFEAQAKEAFAAMAASGFALPLDVKRTVTLSYLAEVCTRLDDRDHAEHLYELFLPYRDLAVVVAPSTVCCGSVARFLGMLAATMRDWASAETHFEAALAMDERMKAWPWLAHTRFEYSRALLVRGRKKDSVRARELRGMALAAAERLGMGGLTQRIARVDSPN
jgi:class 3 adenylate cyclase/tetratricopeptide (TPR) repeat protein